KKLAKIERLQKNHGIDFESVTNRPMRRAIFGDYVSSDAPSSSLEHVKQAYRFKDQAARTVPGDPVLALTFLRNVKFFTGAEMDCDQTMSDIFWRTKRVIHRVFSHEILSSAITSFLCPAEVKNMKSLVCSAKRDACDARRRLRRELLKLGGIPNVSKLLEDAATSERVTRYERYSVCLDAVAVAKKLHEFHRLRGDPQARREMLSKALKAEGMSIRGDSAFCRDFVSGSTDVDLDEIVGRLKLAKHLFELGGHRTWSTHREAANGKFKELYHMEGLDMKEAFEKSIKG
ncbi:unnamed protein product, partial [Pylaiella littoralis]